MGNGEVYGRFVLTICVVNFDFVFQFCIFVCLLKTATASLYTLGVIKNIIFLNNLKVVLIFATNLKSKLRANCFQEYL